MKILFIYAHPDDETIEAGGAIALSVANELQVKVLICTRGELGMNLTVGKERLSSKSELVDLRNREFETAMDILGVTDYEFLGKDAFCIMESGYHILSTDNQDLEVRSNKFLSALENAISLYDPDIIVTHDQNGGYGHIDHVLVNRAVEEIAVLRNITIYHSISHTTRLSLTNNLMQYLKVLLQNYPYTAFFKEILRRRTRRFYSQKINYGEILEVKITFFAQRKLDALRAYRSQLLIDSKLITYLELQMRKRGCNEYFILHHRSSRVRDSILKFVT